MKNLQTEARRIKVKGSRRKDRKTADFKIKIQKAKRQIDSRLKDRNTKKK